MGVNYHAEIINLSQKDNSVMKQFQILGLRKRFLGYVKIYTVSMPAEEISNSVLDLQANMSTKLKKNGI